MKNLFYILKLCFSTKYIFFFCALIVRTKVHRQKIFFCWEILFNILSVKSWRSKIASGWYKPVWGKVITLSMYHTLNKSVFQISWNQFADFMSPLIFSSKLRTSQLWVQILTIVCIWLKIYFYLYIHHSFIAEINWNLIS